MNCYVCKLPTTVNIPESEPGGMFVPCCQKCYQTYSVEGAWKASKNRIAHLELLNTIIEKTNDLKYTLSVDTDIDVTPSWKIEEICELLYKLENEL